MNPQEAKKKIGAQFFLPVNHTNMKDVPALYYKIKNEQHNDGKVKPHLQYRSTFDIWMGTTVRNPEKFIKEKLIRIE